MIQVYTDKYKDGVEKLFIEMHKESRFNKYELSTEKLFNLLKNNNFVLFVSTKDEEPVGIFMGAVGEMFFSTQKAGFDLLLYVDKKYRGGMVAPRLIKRFEAFCKEKDCVTVNLEAKAGISNESAKRLYTKLGYNECGFASYKDI